MTTWRSAPIRRATDAIGWPMQSAAGPNVEGERVKGPGPQIVAL
jgi:hypothetical protein